MADANLIATLVPLDDRLKDAFALAENEAFCRPPSKSFADDPVMSSRESTPACDTNPGTHDYTHHILLTFDRPPSNRSKGYAFGGKKKQCDVVLSRGSVEGLSKIHFYITFIRIQEKNHLVLRDCSTHGTAVSYNGVGQDEQRSHFRWILDLEEKRSQKAKPQQIRVHIGCLEFQLEVASHLECQEDFEKNVRKFLKDSEDCDQDPNLIELNIDSYSTKAPSQSLTPAQRPFYIRTGEIASGSFATVNSVVNMSTGITYAQKVFFKRQDRDVERWERQIKNEIKIMALCKHKFVMPIVDYRYAPDPFLVMPYMPVGDLGTAREQKPLADEEIIALLFQGLTVLEHLHSQGVIYRDLKPPNILVKARNPLHLQFTDFGLSSCRSNALTFCGTPSYLAPEASTFQAYSSTVDIWSLGVILMELIHGLPTPSWEGSLPSRGQIRDYPLSIMAELHWLDAAKPLTGLLKTGMLCEVQSRFSATQCLATARQLGIRDESVKLLREAPAIHGIEADKLSSDDDNRGGRIKHERLRGDGQNTGPTQSPPPSGRRTGTRAKRPRPSSASASSNPSREDRTKRRPPESLLPQARTLRNRSARMADSFSYEGEDQVLF